MLLEYYGLREQPFGVSPDPAYLYFSRTHSEALTSISFGIADNRGFFALVAEPGMGKTTLLYRLLEELRDTTRTVLLFQTQCTSREFIEYILQELGVDVTGMSFVAMHGKLNEILFEELLEGKRFVLVVDEAQNLDDAVLETVRMLSNFETHNTKLLQIILAGQPQLAAKLSEPRFSQLRQRISILSRLEPLTEEETGLYIKHRLKVAAYSGEPIFDPASIGLIASASHGIPRNINNLCYHSMLLAYNRKLRTVTPEIVREVVARLDMKALASQPPAEAETATPPAAPVPAVSASTAPKSVLPPPAPPAPPPAAPNVKSSTPPTSPSSSPNPKERRAKSFLTYSAGREINRPGWQARAALIAAIILSTALLAAILGRSLSRRSAAPRDTDNSSIAPGAVVHADQPEAAASSGYDAAPQDTGDGLVLTVAAGPQQTLQDLALRYAGYFDNELSEKIISLNPGLKDPDHLEAGQLIRIPLPRGAIRKINDTGEASASSQPASSGGLFSRLVALLRDRK